MHMWHKRLGTLLIALVANCVVVSAAFPASPYEWTVSQLSRGKTALILTDAAQTVTLRAGWVCLVEPPSGTAGLESRTTTCRKNKEEFRFKVQCEPSNPKDDTMIQFGEGNESDYIEVTCAPRRLALLPNNSLERTRAR
jgi:hypothetical protein